MEPSFSDEAPLNTKPSHLETDQDLLRDQLDYFRATNQLPDLPQQDEHHLSLLSRPEISQTPTSSCLEPVKERVVSRKSRRRPRSKLPSASPNPFPQVTPISDHAPNRFARKLQSSKTENNQPSQHYDATVSEQIRARVESMSIEQIREAQQEIHDTLKPESIQILKKMWLKKSQTASHPEMSVLSAHVDTPAEQMPATEHYTTGDQRPLHRKHLSHDQQSEVKRSLAIHAHTELLVPEKDNESDEEERNKRVWMTDAEGPAPSQREVDHLIENALKRLGQIGKLRFGLDGAVLSPEEIQTLPTHLGLHHHGSSPANAGYTLPDILILMRSTVGTQRVMAMRMLKSVLLQHRDNVVSPLIESGTLTSVFSHLPSDEPFYAAFTNQSAYVELIECFIAEDLLPDRKDSINNLYFASNFYSPCGVMNYSPVIKALADSDVVTTLVGIAIATALLREHSSLAERALCLLQLFVTKVPNAAYKVLQNKTSLLRLKAFTSAPTGYSPILFKLSCEVLAYIVVSLGWRGGQVLEEIKADVINDRFIHSMSTKLVWLLDSDIEEITKDRSVTVQGVLRLMRAALAFQEGIEAFAALAQVVCRLIHNEATGTETYLALEAYSHALFVQANSPTDEEVDRKPSHTLPDSAQDGHTETLIYRRLSDLIPMAISATSFFVDRRAHSEESRAAAGHFAGTLFALTSHPIVEEYVRRIMSMCLLTKNELVGLVAASPQSIQKIQLLASLSHATARLLSKVKLEEGFVEREAKVLFKILHAEETAMEKSSTVSTIRIVGNACAEWIALYSRVGSAQATAEFSLKLLPYLTDVRVIVDFLSRTLLNVKVLRGLRSTLSDAIAEKCVKELLPLMMMQLSSLQESQGAVSITSGHLSFEDMCSLWITNENVFESLFTVMTVYFEAALLKVTPLLECLLRTPAAKYSNSVFQFMFKVAQSCVKQGAPLIASRDKTMLSSLSTTVNSPLTDSVQSLCDFLLSRGPVPMSLTDDENPDFLSSVLMTLMCGPDIDTTLRVSMWKRTVDDCGGAALYQDAVILEEKSDSAKVSSCPQLDDLLRMFGVSISEGCLDGERCPSVLRTTILARIETALLSGRTVQDVFELMSSSVRSRSSLIQGLVKLSRSRPLTSMERDKRFSRYLDEVRGLN